MKKAWPSWSNPSSYFLKRARKTSSFTSWTKFRTLGNIFIKLTVVAGSRYFASYISFRCSFMRVKRRGGIKNWRNSFFNCCLKSALISWKKVKRNMNLSKTWTLLKWWWPCRLTLTSTIRFWTTSYRTNQAKWTKCSRKSYLCRVAWMISCDCCPRSSGWCILGSFRNLPGGILHTDESQNN